MDSLENGVRPATVLFTWDVTPGRESDFEEWAHGINCEAARFHGHLGATWLRAEGIRHRYYVVLTFSDEDRLATWLESPERKEWLGQVEGIAEAQRHRMTGLETWFSVPGEAVPPLPLPAGTPSPARAARRAADGMSPAIGRDRSRPRRSPPECPPRPGSA
jgi:antibiotic biosynthesis monooxygenase (ABM) superfamily enzyme